MNTHIQLFNPSISQFFLKMYFVALYQYISNVISPILETASEDFHPDLTLTLVGH